MAEELNDQEHRETELWQVLDWSLWGNGLGDVLRESIADKTFAAITVEERETAERCIKAWHERRGPSMAVGEGTELAKRVAYLEARVGELNNTIGELRAEVVDLDDRRARWALEHQKRSEELERSEASRQAWAEEAQRLQQEKDDLEAPAPWDYPHEWRDNGGGDPYYNIKGDCRSCGRDFHDEIHDEPFGPPPVPPGPDAPCACLAEGVTLPAGWVRPQCAVHPDGVA